jgi:hypothetical protein
VKIQGVSPVAAGDSQCPARENLDYSAATIVCIAAKIVIEGDKDAG